MLYIYYMCDCLLRLVMGECLTQVDNFCFGMFLFIEAEVLILPVFAEAEVDRKSVV